METRQVIWVSERSTTFAGLCEECLTRPSEPSVRFPYRLAKVVGTLRADADVGFTRCNRGHPIALRRNRRAA